MNKQILSAHTIIAHLGFALFLIVAFVASFFITGCSDSNPVGAGSGPGTASASAMQEGSFFVLTRQETDSNGQTSPVTYDTIVVGAMHASWAGKENVRQFNSSTGSSYFHYEPNGDLTTLDANGNWNTIPFSGQNVPAPQRSEQQLGDTAKFVLIMESRYLNSKSITIGARAYTMLGFEQAVTLERYTHLNVKDGSRVDRRKVVVQTWFIPELGFFGEITGDVAELDYRGNAKRQLDHIESKMITAVVK
jgi:hypothetical protein